MKKILTAAAFLSVSFTALSQSKTLGLEAKTSIGFYQLKPIDGFLHRYTNARGYALGVGINYQPYEPVFLTTGVSFSRLSYKVAYDFVMLQPNDPSIPLKADVQADYLEIPLMLNLNLQQNEKTNLYLNGGFIASFRIADNDRTTFRDGTVRNSGYLQSKVNSWQFGVGFRYRLNKNIGLIFEPQYRLFTSKIDRWMNQKPSAIYASVGLFLKRK